MKKFSFLIIAAALFLGIGGPCPAQAAETKIGVVNMSSVVNDSAAGLDALNDLKSMAEKENATLKRKQESLRAAEKELEQLQKSSVAKPQAVAEKESEVFKARRELEIYQEDTRRALQTAQNRSLGALLNNIKKIIADYAKQNGYTLILKQDDSPPPFEGAVMYADNSVELTATVIRIFNQQYQASKGGGASKQ